MSDKIKVAKVSILPNRKVSFHRLWKNCKSHRKENGGNGYCRTITYKVRGYWYEKIKEMGL